MQSRDPKPEIRNSKLAPTGRPPLGGPRGLRGESMTKSEIRNEDPTAAPAAVMGLVGRFAEHADAYRAGRYNEAQLRQEFLDPLFKALGWDVDNEQGYAEAYKDVIHEDAINVGGATKAPDYCFRIGGVRKFFVEAKKPSIDIKGDPSPAYQLRRYAWSAKLPLSILTDFEELAVYDCRVKPARTDKASAGRTLFIRYDELPERWGELASIFAREAILKGSFDKYAESAKRKRGTAEVDDAFLADIEQWRETLAHNIALRNAGLSQRELNFAVQRTIDRIVFLRICEDRGIEQYGTLLGLTNGQQVYARLFERFRRADERYNSGLFHFARERGRPEGPDELTPGLAVDDKPLKEILARLYYPESPYEFSVLPADILGHVYEQFLGKVIRLTKGHRAVVEEKPEVRKAGGVYYTPTYIVDYIVRHTVGKLVEGNPRKTPQEVGGLTKAYQPSKAKGVRPLAVLDPACGSGSFLLGAYQFLLDWYRDRYIEDGPKKHAAGRNPRLFQHSSGEWRLTITERKRILLSHIYGVDIDLQAVEVTKLSLLLKVLEGENAETIGYNLRLFHERALPNLASNIKCGNSLIHPDFYDNQQMDMFDEEERLRINVFDWHAEFKDIMAAGGFDAVIGNPPYGADYTKSEKAFFQSRYVYRKGKPETYIFFLEKGIEVLANHGALAFITPNAWLTNYYGEQIRRYMLSGGAFQYLVDLEPTRVFVSAVVDTAIVVFHKASAPGRVQISRGTRDHSIEDAFQAKQADWQDDHSAVINLHARPEEVRLLRQLESSCFRFESVIEYSQGIIPYKTRADGAENQHIAATPGDASWMPLLERASQIRRYEVDEPTAHVHYGPWLWCEREPKYFFPPKLLFHRLRKKLPRQLVGAIDLSPAVNRHALSNLILRAGEAEERLWALLGVFNSKLANWWFAKRFGMLMEVGGFKVSQIPLPKDWPEGLTRLGEMAQSMTELHKQMAAAKTAHAKTAIERQIDATDRQIDQLVYELYGLTEEEIRIVEETTKT